MELPPIIGLLMTYLLSPPDLQVSQGASMAIQQDFKSLRCRVLVQGFGFCRLGFRVWGWGFEGLGFGVLGSEVDFWLRL